MFELYYHNVQHDSWNLSHVGGRLGSFEEVAEFTQGAKAEMILEACMGK